MKLNKNIITLCGDCYCMTKSIRKSRATFICGKCGYDKTLGDVFQYENKQQFKKEPEVPIVRRTKRIGIKK